MTSAQWRWDLVPVAAASRPLPALSVCWVLEFLLLSQTSADNSCPCSIWGSQHHRSMDAKLVQLTLSASFSFSAEIRADLQSAVYTWFSCTTIAVTVSWPQPSKLQWLMANSWPRPHAPVSPFSEPLWFVRVFSDDRSTFSSTPAACWWTVMSAGSAQSPGWNVGSSHYRKSHTFLPHQFNFTMWADFPLRRRTAVPGCISSL